jgi:adenylosuccinate lyase
MINKLPQSRLQRDLSGSTLVRDIPLIFGYMTVMLHSTKIGFTQIGINKELVESKLDEHYEVLGEYVQTYMRLNGYENPYNSLKNAIKDTKSMNKTEYIKMLERLNLKEEDIKFLSQMSPRQYKPISFRTQTY